MTAGGEETGDKASGLSGVAILGIALLIGMFIKPAETLINGIALRLFEAIKTLVK